ncbi:MAG: alpha/beta hydrolase [Cypionkella sp.]
MPQFLRAALAAILALVAAAAEAEELSIAGPGGPLAGTLMRPAPLTATVVIVPGSGPTDRDGNNPLGVTAAPYRLLAEALRERGFGSLRFDKRGMFASKAAGADANAVTIDDYAADVAGWVAAARQATGSECVWLLGHSEGGLVALAAAPHTPGLCGIILVAAPGRPMGRLLREQLRANPANAPILDQALTALEALEAGRRVDTGPLPPPLKALFAEPVQDYLIDLLRRDPAALAADTRLPLLIVSGGRDIQVGPAEAAALHAAQPAARLAVVPEMNHVLKDVGSADRAANLAAYGDPARPVSPALIDAIAAFVRDARPPDSGARSPKTETAGGS